ncbi:MAG: pyrimidine 5'-nucleotidase [Mariprofundaceae bacterium]|nr:pyrimidine 5'-nucleotidase [Mariprofundaceae bacterium]
MPFDLAVIDLDNTLYAANNGVFDRMDQRMTAYVAKHLALPEEEANALRIKYWHQYGTTLRGLILHHHVDAEDFLTDAHNIAAHELLENDSELNEALHNIESPKVIHTNGTREHAQTILKALGISHHFHCIYDIRFRDYIPKPCAQTLEKLLKVEGVTASRSLIIDDMTPNLEVAQILGAKTCWVADQPQDNTWDYHVTSFHQIPSTIIKKHGI